MIHTSLLDEVTIPEAPVTDHVLEKARELGDKPALIDGPSGRAVTYAQLADGIAALAGGLRAKGFGAGSTLALLSPNLPEYAIVFHGVARSGGTITTINPTYTPDEIRHQLEDSGANLMVTIPQFVDTARKAIEGTLVDELYVLGEHDDVASLTSIFGEPLTEQQPNTQDGTFDPDALVVMPYSSGTTGKSKGVMLSHRNLVANIEQTMVPAEITEDETVVAVLPFFHIYGMQVLMNCGLRAGATIITMPRMDFKTFLEVHQEHGVTRSFVAPPIVLALAKEEVVDAYDLSALEQVFSGAAPLSAELAEEAGERLGCAVVQGYGMTEMSPVSHLTPPGRVKAGSCGILAPNTEMKVIDVESGDELGVGEDGEIWIRGPQVMMGYLNREQETSDTVDEDGFIHTGDIGHVDDDGHLFIVDRLKELIKYKGFQVPPAELESLLLTHDGIADSAVIGIPEIEAGELPAAYVVTKPGVELTADQVKDFVAGKVATYKQLHQVVFVDEIPKSASGKILRRELRDREDAQEV